MDLKIAVEEIATIFGLAGKVMMAELEEAQQGSKHVKGMPRRFDKYYEACKERYGESAEAKEYCVRVAKTIYCTYVNPQSPSCGPGAKGFGPPYSAPLTTVPGKGTKD